MRKFPTFEWSGPAWYSIEKDEAGFPNKMVLEYFHPLHLGNASSTDWDGKELINIYKELKTKFPEIGKTWIQGNIHSHHSMGAFFSGVDNQQLVDGSNENFYGSLVVSTKPGKEYAFAISYPDQYGRCHITHGDIVPEHIINVDKEIVAQAEYIKEQKSKRPKLTRPQLYNKKQTSMFNNPETTLFEDIADLESVDLLDRDQMDVYYSAMQELSEEDFETFDKLWFQYESGLITEDTRNIALKNMGLDENGKRITDIAL